VEENERRVGAELLIERERERERESQRWGHPTFSHEDAGFCPSL
jgi:hypothetical protein